ncbi:M16 family metallopeptidase [Salinispirillum marinum]|uniref:M16 family metallopeptidase n=2 Tax=Saccharospirillaceae TaxID=255527 RepID=A0ABV8BCF7_9GAMM
MGLNRMRALRAVVWLVFLVGVQGCAALLSPTSTPQADQAVFYAPDEQITDVQLDNGVRALVKTLPDNGARPRVEIRLHVAAGSAQEEAHERGLAHFVEHMAFNGTERFPRQDIIRFFEAAGMRFGQDINAYTSFHETVYTLSIPLDRPDLLNTAYDLLHDWAQGITFAEDAVMSERGVILEEWRAAGYAGDEPVWLQHHRFLHAGTPYSERYPIGVREVFTAATAELLRGYYDRWYRPELMTVVVSGVVEADAVLAGLNEGLGQFKARTPAVRYDRAVTPSYADTRYQVVNDPQAAQSSMVFKQVLSRLNLNTEKDVLAALQANLLMEVLATRLNRRATQADSALSDGQVLQDRLTDGKSVVGVRITPRAQQEDAALQVVAEEIERLRRYGITEQERSTAFGVAMGQYSSLVRYLEGAPANVHANVMLSLLALDLPMTRFDTIAEVEQALFSALTLEEINAFAETLLLPADQVIAAFLTDEAYARLAWDADALAKVTDRVRMGPITAPIAAAALRTTGSYSHPGAIVAQTSDTDHGLEYWRMSNNLTAVIHPTTVERDKVYLRFVGIGGQMVSDPALVPALRLLPAVFQQQGALDRDGVDLSAYLTTQEMTLDIQLGIPRFEIQVATTQDTMDDAVRLLAEVLSRSTIDPTALTQVQQQYADAYRNFDSTPAGRFQRSVAETLFGGQPPFTPPGADDFSNVDLAQMQAAQRLLTEGQTEYVLLVVGDVDTIQLQNALTDHLAGLPLRSPEQPIWQTGTAEWEETRIEQFDNPNERADVTVYFSTPDVELTPENFAANRVLNDLFSTRLLQEVREQASLVYSIGASTLWSLPQRPQRLNVIRFSTDPERTDEALARVQDVLSTLRSQPFTEQEVVDARQRLINGERDNLARNTGLLDAMIWTLNIGTPLWYFRQPELSLGGATTERVNALGEAMYLQAERLTTVHSIMP